MKKKLFSLILCSVILLRLFDIYTYADSGDDFTYTPLSSGGYELSSVRSTAFEITVPDTYNGSPVYSVSDVAFSSLTGAYKIALPSELNNISAKAFENCASLTEIYSNGSSYVSYGGVLYSADGKTLVAYPKNKTDEYALMNSCTSIGAYAFCKSKVKTVNLNKAERIDGYAFAESAIVSIDLSKVTSIGKYAFYGSALKTVNIPLGITLGEYAFACCYNLGSADVSTLSPYCFADCLKLTTANIYAPVISEYSFLGCSALAYPGLRQGIKSIKAGAFKNASVKAAALDANVTSVGTGAFENCNGLVIYAPSGSFAAKYAADNKITYIENTMSTRAGKTAFSDNLKELIPGNTYTPSVTVNASLTEYFLISSDESVVSVSGKTLTAKSVGNAEITAISADGAYKTVITANVSDGNAVIESSHPYGNSASPVYSYTVSGNPEKIAVTFSKATYTEYGSDFIGVYDKSDSLIGSYTGSSLSGKTLLIDGDTVKIKLVSDKVNTFYGFKVIKAVAVSSLNEVKGITLSESSLVLTAGETHKLTADITPADALLTDLLYITSDKNTVTVNDKGELTAIRKGSADITVYSAYYSVSAVCKVTVNENDSNGIIYSVNGSNATIVFYRGNEANLSIPSKIDGYTVTAIKDSAFAYCLGLKTVNIPSTVSTIGNGAFNGCTSLTSITVDSASQSFSSVNGALYNYYKTTLHAVPAGISGSYTVAAGTVAIRDYAFAGCIRLTGVVLPSSMQTVSGLAFYNCNGITSVTANNSYLKSENGILYNSDLTALIYYPSGIKGNADIKSGVKNIADFSFVTCNDIPCVNIPASVITVGADAFAYSTTVAQINVDKANTVYKSVNGIVYSKDGTVLYRVPSAYKGAVTVEKTVVTVAQSALFKCKDVSYVDLPRGVKNIEKYSFFGTSLLYTLILPDTVTSITYPCFDTGMSVYIPPSVTAISKLSSRVICEKGSYAESYCIENGIDYVYGYAVYSDNYTALCTSDCGLELNEQPPEEIQTLTGRQADVYKPVSSGAPGAFNVVFKTDRKAAFGISSEGIEALPAIDLDGYLFVTVPHMCEIALCGDNTADTSVLGIRSLPDKTDYKLGETLDTNGLKLYYRTPSGISAVVAQDYTTAYSFDKPGESTVTVTYKGLTASFTVTVDKTEIAGTLKIIGTAEYDTVLTADISQITPNKASLTYQWYSADSAIASATSSAYTVKETDIGKKLYVVVSGTGGYDGTVTSSTVTAVKANSGSPVAAKLLSKTSDTITLVDYTGYEYRMSGTSTYYDDPVFKRLTPGTSYTIYQRIKETSTHTASETTYIRVTTNGVYEMTSPVYNINKANGIISKIEPQTQVSTFITGLREQSYIKVYKDGTQITGSTYIGTGCELRLYNGTTLMQTLTVVITGDINGDGKITLTDFVQLKDRIQADKSLKNAYEYACDINGDGKTSLTDFVQLKTAIQGTTQLKQNAY